MCIWPVALVNAGDPNGAARQAYELSALIHTGEVDYCTDAAAALAAATAAGFLADATLADCIDAAFDAIRPVSGHRFRTTLDAALRLVSETGSFREFRTAYQERFSRPIFCDSLETVPAAFALARLAGGRTSEAVEYGANFGRDSDTIASMAGALTAPLMDELPAEWLLQLGDTALGSARALADQLFDTARKRIHAQEARLAAAHSMVGEDR